MPDIFDTLPNTPLASGPGSVFDFDATSGEAFDSSLSGAIETNPVPIIARAARGFSEDMASLAGANNRVDAKAAREEVAKRGLDLKIPDGGISRWELDTLQYLKQRENQRAIVSERTRGLGPSAASLAGSFAGGAVDPINVASAFIPVVPEARYASWLAKAGTSFAERAAVRAGAGALEGGVGAALVEPINYLGAQHEQRDYGIADSFLNVMFGTVLGGGLHVAGGAIYDARVSRVLRSLDTDIQALAFRDAAAHAPEHVHLQVMQDAVAAMERGEPVDAEASLRAYHGSPHFFERPSLDFVGKGADVQSHGHGLYAVPGRRDVAEAYSELSRQMALPEGKTRAMLDDNGWDVASTVENMKAILADSTTHPDLRATAEDVLGYLEKNGPPPREAQSGGHLYEWNIKAKLDEMIDWDKPVEEQAPSVRAALKARGVTTQQEMHAFVRDPKNTADLRQDGVKGVVYEQNQMKQHTGDSWREYVVFDPKDIETISRNGEPVGPSGPRGLSDLIPQAAQERTADTFNRQFVDDPADVQTSKAADEAAKATDMTPEDIASDTEQFTAHLDSMRERGLVDEHMEADLKAADEAAKGFEAEAQGYEAAGVCELDE